MGGVCRLAHSPPELLPAPGQALGFVSHQVQCCTSHLLLEGAPVPANAQAAEGGVERHPEVGRAAQTPTPLHPRQDQQPLTPARCQNPWAGRGCRMPGPAGGPPPSASWLLVGVLAAAASGRQLP